MQKNIILGKAFLCARHTSPEAKKSLTHDRHLGYMAPVKRAGFGGFQVTLNLTRITPFHS